MPSRKRAKGKARKAKARESNCSLILHNESVCRHGCEVISKDDICYKFVEQFEVELNAVYDSKLEQYKLSTLLSDIVEQMKARKEYSMICDNDSKETQQTLQSLFIHLGTNLLLRDNKQRSVNLASAAAAFYITSSHDFDYWKAMDASKDRVTLRNVESGLAYDNAKLFKERIPCQCLEKLYVRERSKPRLSDCCNCQVEKDRRELYLCSNCLYHHYCGVECQAAAWPKHKSVCKGFNPRNDCGI